MKNVSDVRLLFFIIFATKYKIFNFTLALPSVSVKYLHIPSCYYSHIFFCSVSSAAPADENCKARELVNVLQAPHPHKHSRHADRLYSYGLTQVKQQLVLSGVSSLN